MSVRLVRPEEIVLGTDPSRRDVEYQKNRLLREGQIEPVLLIRDELICDTLGPYGNVHAEAIVCAAHELGWDSILVTDDPRTSG